MIIKSLLRRIRRRISQRKLIQTLVSQGIEINLPFCGNINQVEFTPPIYIGPGAWLNLAGKLYIGAGTIIGPGLKVLTANHNWKGTGRESVEPTLPSGKHCAEYLRKS